MTLDARRVEREDCLVCYLRQTAAAAVVVGADVDVVIVDVVADSVFVKRTLKIDRNSVSMTVTHQQRKVK